MFLNDDLRAVTDPVPPRRRPQRRPDVVRALTLSTRHLPVPLLAQLDQIAPQYTQRLRHGYLLTVPELTIVTATMDDAVTPDTLPTIWLYALGKGCRLVLFDHAGPVMTDLRVYHD
jgi:hypothetical protein